MINNMNSEQNKKVKIISSAVVVANENHTAYELLKNIGRSTECAFIETYGKYGWAVYSQDFLNKTQMLAGDEMLPMKLENLEKEGRTVKEIDKYFSDNLRETVHKYYEDEIKNKILKENYDDELKIHSLFDDFKQEKYYECASIIFGLIDAKIIKLNVSDYEYKDKNGKEFTDGEKIKQGIKAFFKLYNNNFKKFFNNHPLKMKTNQITFNDFVEEVKLEMDLYVGYEFFNIAYPILVFFKDSDWEKYSTKKPEIINRNWLMHGMYNYSDITKADCMKLFLLYYQLICFLEKYWEV